NALGTFPPVPVFTQKEEVDDEKKDNPGTD
ncbi:unnamed protein product, partial [marine sediment metagenome]